MNPSKFEEQSKEFLFNVFSNFNYKDWEFLMQSLLFGDPFEEACDFSKLYYIIGCNMSVKQYYKVRPFVTFLKNNYLKDTEYRNETGEIVPEEIFPFSKGNLDFRYVVSKIFEEQCKKFETSLKEIINDSWNDIKHFYHIDNQGYFDNNFNWYPNKELIPDDHISDSEKESYENFEKNSLISVTDLVFSKSNSYYLISYV